VLFDQSHAALAASPLHPLQMDTIGHLAGQDGNAVHGYIGVRMGRDLAMSMEPPATARICWIHRCWAVQWTIPDTSTQLLPRSAFQPMSPTDSRGNLGSNTFSTRWDPKHQCFAGAHLPPSRRAHLYASRGIDQSHQYSAIRQPQHRLEFALLLGRSPIPSTTAVLFSFGGAIAVFD